MSQENVEVVRRALESFEGDVEAWLERGRGRRSGIAIESGIGFEDRTLIHAKVRAGKIVCIYEHDTRAEALGAAGLRK